MFCDVRISAFGSRVEKHGASQSLGSFCGFVLPWTNELHRALALLLPLVGEAAWSVVGGMSHFLLKLAMVSLVKT
jgi:hypothetical protein